MKNELIKFVFDKDQSIYIYTSSIINIQSDRNVHTLKYLENGVVFSFYIDDITLNFVLEKLNFHSENVIKAMNK